MGRLLTRCSPRCEAHEHDRERARDEADKKPDDRRATLLVGKPSSRDRNEDPCRQRDGQPYGEHGVQRTGGVESHSGQDTRPARVESSLPEAPQHTGKWMAGCRHPHLDRFKLPAQTRHAVRA
jgi:hypothetical protein